MLLHNNPHSSILVKAQATYYPHMVSVYVPNQPFLRRPSTDPSPTRHSTMEEDSYADSRESNLERSLRRTKKRISDYILCNNFELFTTFTFGKNRQDINEKRRQMSDWLRNQRKRNGKFDYLIVPELHKDGESLHFHALLYAYCGSIERAINPKTGKPITNKGKPVYTLPEYTLGFNNAQNIALSTQDRQRIAYYVKKYITKDMPTFKRKQRYWASKNLKTPIIQDNPEKWYEVATPDWEIEVDKGRILRFNVGKQPLVDMYWKANK